MTHSSFLFCIQHTPGEAKPNTNGTSYLLGINNAYRNADGYVDFE
jgi:hypothetical protein